MNARSICLRLFFAPLLLWSTIAAAGAQPSDKGTAAAAVAPTTADLTGAHVKIQLRTGKTLADVEVLESRPGKSPGSVTLLNVLDAATGKRVRLSAAAIEQVIGADGRCRLVYDKAAKVLGPLDAESRKRQEEQLRKEHEAARIAVHEKTGVWLWPELTDEQQQAAVVENKQYIEKVTAAFNTSDMRLHETRYFLFLSDMPDAQVAMYLPYLDKMYHELCKAFAIAEGTNIWRGKAVVIAFAEKRAFEKFESRFFNNNDVTAAGIAHQGSNGTVIISCYRGNDPIFFAKLLVHETTHGFIHRYKSPQRVPNWLDEGAADWIAAAVVTAWKGVQRSQQRAIAQMRETGTLGGDFFTLENIHDWQYGAASSITDFLLRTDPKGYRRIIDGIKDGLTWQESLKKTYDWTPEQLLQQYGVSIGVPDLKP